MSKIRIEYTPFAKSIPEYSKRDGSVYTCSLGFSPQLGLIRVYPIPIVGISVGKTYSIEVEKNARDTRPESWKLSTYAKHEGWDHIILSKDCIEVGKASTKSLSEQLKPYIFESVDQLNKERRSIGFIKPQVYNFYWDSNSRFINTGQYGMFEDVAIADFTKYTKDTQQMEARVRFLDKSGKHDLQYNEWGVYEYIRKGGEYTKAFNRHNEQNGFKHLLLGNMHSYRNVWITLAINQIIVPITEPVANNYPEWMRATA